MLYMMKKWFKKIQFIKSSINKNLNTIFLTFKDIEAIWHDRTKEVINKLFSLLMQEIKNDIINIKQINFFNNIYYEDKNYNYNDMRRNYIK
jgi:hypothetical protein